MQLLKLISSIPGCLGHIIPCQTCILCYLQPQITILNKNMMMASIPEFNSITVWKAHKRIYNFHFFYPSFSFSSLPLKQKPILETVILIIFTIMKNVNKWVFPADTLKIFSTSCNWRNHLQNNTLFMKMRQLTRKFYAKNMIYHVLQYIFTSNTFLMYIMETSFFVQYRSLFVYLR